jgi:hypothetical protein
MMNSSFSISLSSSDLMASICIWNVLFTSGLFSSWLICSFRKDILSSIICCRVIIIIYELQPSSRWKVIAWLAPQGEGGVEHITRRMREEEENNRSLLSVVFPLTNEMHLFNKKNNSYVIAASVATLFTLAITAASSMATPVAATTTTTTTSNTTTTNTTSSSSGIKLSPQPIYQESTPPGSVTPINQTHIGATHTGNGTLTLPNSNQTINTIGNGTAIVSLATPSAIAKTTIRAPNGETATLTFYEIIQFSNPAEAPLGGGKGIKIIIFHTNSTGMLAPLNGVIAAGINNISPNGESELTAWRWESGIPLPTGNTTATEQSPSSSLMNTTTTNATAADTNLTAAATIPPEEEVVEEQQQQATPTAPAPQPE